MYDCPPYFGEAVFVFQLVGEGDDIDGLARVEHRPHGADDQFMRFLVEVVFAQFI